MSHNLNMADLPLESSPPANISSTPAPSDNPLFSDEPFLASSPPSSPPEFPWEKTSNNKYSTADARLSKPTVSAFSILGKRKSLTSISDNARPAKKPLSTTPRNNDKPLAQMQISIGQEVRKKCKMCGMEYIASSEEDRKLHDKYHKQNAEGFDVGKEFLSKGREGTIFKTSSKEDVIAAVDAFDSVWRKKRAQAALDVVQRELGAVDIPDEQIWSTNARHLGENSSLGRFTVYMYVRQQKCIGLLLAEQITEARKVLEPAKPSAATAAPETVKMSALERLRAKRVAQQASDKAAASQPIQLATKSSPAVLGISRIWVSSSQRGHGIAEVLLNQTLQHHNERASIVTRDQSSPKTQHDEETKDPSAAPKQISKNQVAFSQPTAAGAKLARKWHGRNYGWLVYID